MAHTGSVAVVKLGAASEQFPPTDTADLIIQSIDGVNLHVHKKNLALHSNIFADAAGVSGSRSESGHDIDTSERERAVEVVHLSEKGQILELLFQFMYRRTQPDVSQMAFEETAALAEAAEKYEVFPAIQVCRMCMSLVHAEQHPLQVLNYAGTHGYGDIAAKAAFRTYGQPLRVVQAVLHTDILHRWLILREKQREIIQTNQLIYLAQPPSTNSGPHTYPVLDANGRPGFWSCRLWIKFESTIRPLFEPYVKVIDAPGAFYANMSKYLFDCDMCKNRARLWLDAYLKNHEAALEEARASLVF